MSPNPSLPVVSKLSVFGAVVARSAPRLIEASLIPSALFYCALVFVGIGAAYGVAIVWLYGTLATRLVCRRRVLAPAHPRRRRHHDPDDRGRGERKHVRLLRSASDGVARRGLRVPGLRRAPTADGRGAGARLLAPDTRDAALTLQWCAYCDD